MGGYRRAKKNGKDVAGVSPQHAGGAADRVGDLRRGGRRRGDCHGGRGERRHGDVRADGRGRPRPHGGFADPAGAVFGIWQPGSFPGAELVNEAAAFGWNELGTRDTAGAKEFYGDVFGWGTQEEGSERVGTYTVWTVDDAMVAGMIDMNALELPAEVPPNWLVYFGVENTDAAVEAVKSGGGDVRMGPIDIPVGRFAVVADPHGAVFAVMQPSE